MFNRAARCIVGVNRRARITPILIRFHWLPVKARIMYKYCILVFKVIKTGKPKYLASLLEHHSAETGVATRNQQNPHRLNEPRVNNKWGKRSFYYNAPRMFNRLPNSLKDIQNEERFKKT